MTGETTKLPLINYVASNKISSLRRLPSKSDLSNIGMRAKIAALKLVVKLENALELKESPQPETNEDSEPIFPRERILKDCDSSYVPGKNFLLKNQRRILDIETSKPWEPRSARRKKRFSTPNPTKIDGMKSLRKIRPVLNRIYEKVPETNNHAKGSYPFTDIPQQQLQVQAKAHLEHQNLFATIINDTGTKPEFNMGETSEGESEREQETAEEQNQDDKQQAKTCLMVLKSAARHWKAIKDQGKSPSMKQFSSRSLHPLYLELIPFNESGAIDLVEEISALKIPEFLECYLSLLEEKYGSQNWENSILKFCALTNCSPMKATNLLGKSGWDSGLAFELFQGNKIKSRDEKAIEKKSKSEASRVVEKLEIALKNNMYEDVRLILPSCSNRDVEAACVAAIGMPQVDNSIVELLIVALDDQAERRVLLSATLSNNCTILSTFIKLKHPSASTIETIFVSAAIRGKLEVVTLLVCSVPQQAMDKALMAAAFKNQLSIARYLLPMVSQRAKMRARIAATHKSSMFESIAEIDGFRNQNELLKGDRCVSYFMVQHLISSLHLIHGICFEDATVVDLSSGNGQAIMACCLSGRFSNATGFEIHEDLWETSVMISNQYNENCAQVFNPDSTSQTKDRVFINGNFSEDEIWCQNANLVLATMKVCPTEEQLGKLGEKCILAFYTHGEAFENPSPNLLQPLSKDNWDVYIRNSLKGLKL